MKNTENKDGQRLAPVKSERACKKRVEGIGKWSFSFFF